jgi:hypothetical protein
MATLLAVAACATPKGEATWGVQEGHRAYVPARIAILPCQSWPTGSRPQGMPLTNAKADVLAELCAAFDAFVVQGFSDQPYMKGFSPTFVLRSLATAGREPPATSLPKEWKHEATDCVTCSTPVAFYAQSIAPRTGWRIWLTQLAGAVRNADAVLLPLVTYAEERTYDDRGLTAAERAAGLALLLIDTATGQLLWAGGREAAAPASLTPPPWTETSARLLGDDIWRDFPGRMTP